MKSDVFARSVYMDELFQVHIVKCDNGNFDCASTADRCHRKAI